MPLTYLVQPERRTRKPTGMESFSESACFYRLRDLFWCIAEPDMAPYLTDEQSTALAAFEHACESLRWRVIPAYPHISELPDDDLSPLVALGERLFDLIEPQTHHATNVA